MLRGLVYLAVSALFCFDFMMPPNAATHTRTTAEPGRALTAAVWRSSVELRGGIAVLLSGVSVLSWTFVFGWATWQIQCYSVEILAVALFVVGFSIREWSKRTLGRHFTYEIQRPEALIDDGPYALLLHPSYTGFALEWGCLGAFWQPLFAELPLHYAAPLLVVAYAFALTFLWLWRAKGEEAVMHAAFGRRWDEHVKGRWRFVPWCF